MFSVEQRTGIYEPPLQLMSSQQAHTGISPIPAAAIGTEEVNACRLQC